MLKISLWCLLLLAFNVNADETIHNCERKEHQTELDALSCNLMWEAAGETLAGKYAVGFVTLNRVRSDRYPDNIVDVVYQRKQFSWINNGLSDKVKDKRTWFTCRKVARILMLIKTWDYVYFDITESALFYHNDKVSPVWAGEKNKTVTIGRHTFYRNDLKKHEINLK